MITSLGVLANTYDRKQRLWFKDWIAETTLLLSADNNKVKESTHTTIKQAQTVAGYTINLQKSVNNRNCKFDHVNFLPTTPGVSNYTQNKIQQNSHHS